MGKGLSFSDSPTCAWHLVLGWRLVGKGAWIRRRGLPAYTVAAFARKVTCRQLSSPLSTLPLSPSAFAAFPPPPFQVWCPRKRLRPLPRRWRALACLHPCTPPPDPTQHPACVSPPPRPGARLHCRGLCQEDGAAGPIRASLRGAGSHRLHPQPRPQAPRLHGAAA